MKKIILKTLGFLLSLATLLSVSGCVQREPTDWATSPKVVLNSFESLKDFNAVNVYNALGKIERSADGQYVTEGEYSAKCTIEKDVWKSGYGTPYFYQAANIEYSGSDHTDFAKVSMLTIDVFNTAEQTAQLGVQIVYDFKANSGTGKYEIVGDTIAWMDLKAGYNLVNLNIIKDTIPEVTKEDGTVINQVKGVNIYFERPTDNDKIYYIDNICLHKTENPVKGEARKLKENEICSFDYSWQYKLLTPNSGTAGADYDPVLTWQNDIVSPKSNGGAAVKVSTEHIASWPKTSSNYFVGLILDGSVLNYVDFSQYEGQDKLCFDIYAPELNGVVMMSFGLWRNNNLYYSKQFCQGGLNTLELKRGWNYFEFTVDELNSGEKVTSKVCFATTNKMTFTFRTDDTPNGVFYIDNIRMEKAQ